MSTSEDAFLLLLTSFAVQSARPLFFPCFLKPFLIGTMACCFLYVSLLYHLFKKCSHLNVALPVVKFVMFVASELMLNIGIKIRVTLWHLSGKMLNQTKIFHITEDQVNGSFSSCGLTAGSQNNQWCGLNISNIMR